MEPPERERDLVGLVVVGAFFVFYVARALVPAVRSGEDLVATLLVGVAILCTLGLAYLPVGQQRRRVSIRPE